MSDIPKNSLALYKNRPALVKRVDDKLDIELDNGKSVKVRPKDITLLHPGPLQSLAALRPQRGEIETAWELLAGSATTLAELSELIYETFTPATAWATWQLVDDGLYFGGAPDEITAYTPEEVAQTQATREAKAAEAAAWGQFLERAQQGEFLPDDDRFLRDVEDLALEHRDKSRVLSELGHPETRESAHKFLLEVGYWDETVNPYPQRLGAATSPPPAMLPDLPAEDRLDLTHLPAFAIDDEESQDPDDALSLDGNRLWVHVADVAALVPPDSPADLEARARGANLYLPEGTIPMLPDSATDMLALGLSDTSPALSFGLDLDDDGRATLAEIAPSWVRVQRLTYEAAETRLTEAPFAQLHQLARRCQERRRIKGAALIDLPEVKIRVVEGEVVIRPIPTLKSRDMVQEAMLLTGEAVARFAIEQQFPFLFTTQAPPEETDFPPTLAGMFAYRRNFQRSQTSTVFGPHAGMGLDMYTQSTSPLRRYTDLVAHQQLRAYLRGEGLLSDADILERAGAAEAVTGSVRVAERLSNKHWTLVYLQHHPHWRGKGVLVDIRYSRGQILIPELDLETRLHLREDIPLDSTLSLELRGVNLPELEAYFGYKIDA